MIVPVLGFGQYVFNTKVELQIAVDRHYEDTNNAISQYGEFNTWNVSAITDMSELFKNNDTFNEQISNWDTSNVTNMQGMFYGADEFLELHVKFSNLSMSDERKLTGHGIFAHAFAGDYTFALYDFYASAADINADADLANEVLQKNVKAMELDDKAQQAMNEQYFKYFRMYAENHTDQIRIANESVFYESESHDWSTTKVVTVGKYNVKWGQGSAFRDAWNTGQFENYKNDEGITAVYGTNHLYGSGLGLHIYTFYKDWNAFAAFETANLGQPMDDNGSAFWSAVDAHEDEILVWIGGLNTETKEVYLVN